MTHYLRDIFNYNVVDCETSDNDLHVVIGIIAFSNKLLSLREDLRKDFIADFEAISELRGEWFESASWRQPLSLRNYVQNRLYEIGKKWDLLYLED